MTGKSLYLECYSGITGKMTVGALLDLGADQEVLKRALKSLTVPGFSYETEKVDRAGINVCDFCLIGYEEDTETLFWGKQEFLHAVECADMTEKARTLSVRIWNILAQQQSRTAIRDAVYIVSAAVCLDDLGITDVIVPVLCEGKGTVKCSSTILPVPVPQVLDIIREHHLKLNITDAKGQLITPVGAAIVAAIRTGENLPDEFEVEKTGTGAGICYQDSSGILRAMLICNETGDKDSVIKMETNIDDCSGETLGYVMERLMKEGARDVHYIPAYMKKNRPAWILTVICKKEKMKDLEKIIFEETTSIGIRYTQMERTILKREQRTVTTPYGEAQVKVCLLDGEERFYPEYESVALLSRENHIPYFQMYQNILEYVKELM